MTQQLTLPISLNKHVGFESFVEGKNANLVSHLKRVIEHGSAEYPQTSQRISVLVGQKGYGKTHLLLACCEFAQRLDLDYQYIDLTKLVNMPPQVLLGMVESPIICIDNLHIVDENLAWQTAVFDVINQFIENDQCLIVLSSQKSIEEISYELPDLKTRLNWGVNYVVQSLDDKQKLQALKTQLKLRSIPVSEEALDFMLKRVSRNMHELNNMISEIDKETLASKRKVTIPFIKKTLSL